MTEQEISRKMREAIRNLSTEEGILASSKQEVYGCVFGRDTAITALKLLKVYRKTKDPELCDLVKRSLETLVSLQGAAIRRESGEEPGKFIHEYRKENFSHLIEGERPWYRYPDGSIKNYDSIDATPLALIAIYRYWESTGDNAFLTNARAAVLKGLQWLMERGDLDNDRLLEFNFDHERGFGGLTIHSWTDSHESFLQPDGSMPPYPIAPVEVQGYAWLAYRLWSDYFGPLSGLGGALRNEADTLKKAFNKAFIIEDEGFWYAAQGLDGAKRQIQTITAGPLLCLWASHPGGGNAECIFEERMVKQIVARAFQEDMFDEEAGIRTMSSRAPAFNHREDSYHNGSFWPMLNGLFYEGLLNFNFLEEAMMLRLASLKPISHFDCPIELYQYRKEDKEYRPYQSPSGQTSCREQAWTAAAILDMALPD